MAGSVVSAPRRPGRRSASTPAASRQAPPSSAICRSTATGSRPVQPAITAWSTETSPRCEAGLRFAMSDSTSAATWPFRNYPRRLATAIMWTAFIKRHNKTWIMWAADLSRTPCNPRHGPLTRANRTDHTNPENRRLSAMVKAPKRAHNPDIRASKRAWCRPESIAPASEMGIRTPPSQHIVLPCKEGKN